MQNRRLSIVLSVLAVMIVTLMALGAGVRTMNAGLSCPDWPLCFGKVIPDFHPAVWFEFVHRAYAGLVAIVFACSFVYLMRARGMPRGTRAFAGLGLLFLILQILAGALTVLWMVKWAAVTMHLLLATLFFCSVLWILFMIRPGLELPRVAAPRALRFAAGLTAILIFLQIALGGIVASTYAGSVCVDWPLCNGQWVPTMKGAIGHQISHRFMAYFLAVWIVGLAAVLYSLRERAWVTGQLLRLAWVNVAVVTLQVTVGILNLVYYIPPSITVLHQSLAITLLAVNLRMYFVSRRIAAAKLETFQEFAIPQPR